MQSWKVSLTASVRGNLGLREEVCPNPPLWLSSVVSQDSWGLVFHRTRQTVKSLCLMLLCRGWGCRDKRTCCCQSRRRPHRLCPLTCRIPSPPELVTYPEVTVVHYWVVPALLIAPWVPSLLTFSNLHRMGRALFWGELSFPLGSCPVPSDIPTGTHPHLSYLLIPIS